MLNKIWNKIKFPFIYVWNSFVSATFTGNLHIDDHPNGGSKVWQNHKLFGIKFTLTVVKHTPEPPEVVLEVFKDIVNLINNQENKLVMLPLQPEVQPFALESKPKTTKKKVTKKSAKKKATPKKKSRK
jgi:hypothetical protein